MHAPKDMIKIWKKLYNPKVLPKETTSGWNSYLITFFTQDYIQIMNEFFNKRWSKINRLKSIKSINLKMRHNKWTSQKMHKQHSSSLKWWAYRHVSWKFPHLCVDLISSLHFFKSVSLPSVFSHTSSDSCVNTLHYPAVENEVKCAECWDEMELNRRILQCLFTLVSVSRVRRSSETQTVISHINVQFFCCSLWLTLQTLQC